MSTLKTEANILASANPSLASEWHPTKNSLLTPFDITVGSHKKVWWIGKDCQHEWITAVDNRNRGTNCPICAGRQVLIGYNDLATISPELLDEWHPTKNLPLTPTTITASSGNKLWWLGKKCKHEWQSGSFDKRKGIGCPYCANQKVLIGFNDLASCNPTLASEWHPTKNGNLSPKEITYGSRRRTWWKCILGHEWETTVDNRDRLKRKCPYCSNQKTYAGFNDLATKFPYIAAEWHPTKNGSIQPQDYCGKANKQAWWLCKNDHTWQARIADRTHYASGCPQCSHKISKPERVIVEFLESSNVSVITSDRKILGGKELDIYIPSHKIAIEYNGIYWHSELYGKDRNYHHAKYLACKNLGIQLIQIWEDEWKKNPEQIKAMLLHKLGVTQQEKVFARKTIVHPLKKADTEAFLEQHHVQGYAAGSYYLGLQEKVAANKLDKDKSDSELLAVLVLKKEANGTLNIIRYATSKNVVGGFTKLLSYAETNYKPARFITFSDHCVSDGGLYENNGFANDKELPPDYRYVVNDERKHKFGYRLKRFRDDPNLKWEEGLAERELAALNNIPRIWDAGKTRWVYACSIGKDINDAALIGNNCYQSRTYGKMRSSYL